MRGSTNLTERTRRLEKNNKVWVMCGLPYAVHAFLNGAKKETEVLIADISDGVVNYITAWEFKSIVDKTLNDHKLIAFVYTEAPTCSVSLAGLYHQEKIDEALISYVKNSGQDIYIINLKDHDIYPIQTYALDELIYMNEYEPDYFAVVK